MCLTTESTKRKLKALRCGFTRTLLPALLEVA